MMMEERGCRCTYYTDKCCFRNSFGECTILKDPDFYDDMCHFRKLHINGKNLYDEEKKNRIIRKHG